MNLSEVLNSINHKKESIMDEDHLAEKEYVPFVVNKCLSYFSDTIFHVNEMNLRPDMDKKMQYDFLLQSVRKRKRFSKWMKKDKSDDLQLVIDHYSVNKKKAEEYIEILGEDGIENLREASKKGG
tara:strand:+ start:35 stop:409 length:375 start_codon:yes stop_codon:yes gene_type:complete